MLEEYLSPVSESLLNDTLKQHEATFGRKIQVHTEVGGLPDLNNAKIALIGVHEDRASLNNKGNHVAPDVVRPRLYQLFYGNWDAKVVDLGNIYKGETIEDTYFALKTVTSELLKSYIIPIIIGGGQDLTYAQYRAYDGFKPSVNLTSIDSRFDLGAVDEQLHSQSYLSHIILKEPNFLFNYSNIGYQTYYIHQEEINLMDKLYFDVNRLGAFKDNIEEVEPILRDTDFVSFDISSIKASDAPGNGNASPNGFYAEEACAISRYAGISNKVSSIGFYEYNPDYEEHKITASLISQLIWYFIEGVNTRIADTPVIISTDYTKYILPTHDGAFELVFYKSNKSGRWWVESADENEGKSSEKGHFLVPCSYNDYLNATEGEIPERWWKAYKKFT